VQLSYRGSGTVGGAVRKPRIDWEVGTLRVEVEPDRGIDLRVDTREAEIRVIGTGFTVERDALGTRVAVAHGQVAVNCSDGGSASLLPGASITCRPTHAAGLLGRARALEASGAGPQPVLESAERGLAAGPSEAVREELELIRIEALAASGREAEALEAVARALPLATVRATELRHVAARVAMRSSGCAAALPHLAALAATPGGAGGPELVQYADCLVAGEQTPQRRARVEDLLARALALNPPAEQAADIRTRLRRVAEQD
jgi:hypothetical protein